MEDNKNLLYSIIIITYNNLEKYTIPCFNSILKYSNPKNTEIIFVDNYSHDFTRDFIIKQADKYRHVKYILNEKNLGYAAGNNIGIRESKGKYVILLNNDTLVSEKWLEKLVIPFEDSNVALVGPISNRIGSLQQVLLPNIDSNNWEIESKKYTEKHSGEYFETAKLCFFCVAISREALNIIGLLDTNFGIGNYEDDDYCLRAKNMGFKILINEGCYIWHFGSGSFSMLSKDTVRSLYEQNKKYIDKKHGKINFHYELLLEYQLLVKKYINEQENWDSIIFRNEIINILLEGLSIGKKENIIGKFLKYVDRNFIKTALRYIYNFFIKSKNYYIILKEIYSEYGFIDVILKITSKIFPQINDKKIYKNIDLYDIPIFIITFNRLECLQKQLLVLQKYGFKNISIIDNCSTYKPLVDFLSKQTITVYRMDKNYGHLVLWKCKKFEHIIQYRPFILTDCDVIPDDACPKDFIKIFFDILYSDKKLTKVGFSLHIDDIPDSYHLKNKVINWEKKFWKEKYNETAHFKAAIDTTFALYRPGIRPYERRWWNAVRTNAPYIARHTPWYADSKNCDEETAYYKKMIDPKSSNW